MGGGGGFFGGIGKIFSSAHNNIFKPVNEAVNDVMKVVDPIGGYLKEKTETAADKEAMKLISGLTGGAPSLDAPNPSGTGSGVATGGKAVSNESINSVKARKERAASQKRQGAGTGSTLLMTEDQTRLQGSTLLGE